MGVRENFETVQNRIDSALLRSGRKGESVTLVAVSKKQPLELMRAYESLHQQQGSTAVFGENYVQEYKKKCAALSGRQEAHLIGPLQRNKARDAVKLFDVVESLHSEQIAQALNEEAEKLGKIQKVLLQVNVSHDADKSGFAERQLFELLGKAEIFPALKILGLMTITKLYEKPEDARPDFKLMRDIADRVRAGFPQIWGGRTIELSMGMSADFEIAIDEGATIVRVGTALFGERG